jgi:rhodanese-related sulfurtransferase
MSKNQRFPEAIPNTSPLKNNERIAIYIGIGLIALVFIITFFRSPFYHKLTSEETDKSTSTVQTEDAPKFSTITSNELQQKIWNNTSLTLLDIRDFRSYIKQHIPDAINMPTDELFDASKINRDSLVVLISNTGNDENVEKSIETLKQSGIDKFVVLAGGMNAWNESTGNTVTFGDPTTFSDQSKVLYIEPEQAKKLLAEENNNRVFILDASDASIYANGHIPGAVNIPLLEIEKRRNEIPSYKDIYVTGATEVQAFQAAVQINDIYFKMASIIKGAMPKWKQLNYDIAK